MKRRLPIHKLISLIALFLVCEPLIKVVGLKLHSSLEWSLLWDNLVNNGHSFSRFFTFWVLAPLSGIFLLSMSSLSFVFYAAFSLYRIYCILSHTPYAWPYLTEMPHAVIIAFEFLNFLMMVYLFYPLIQRFILSRYLRNYWDARGRVDCNLATTMFLEKIDGPIKTTLSNISSGGARLHFKINKELESYHEGSLMLMDDEGVHHHYRFRVMNKNQTNGNVIAGIQFYHLTPRERIMLRHHFVDEFIIEQLDAQKVT
jgi:hypothetical protein